MKHAAFIVLCWLGPASFAQSAPAVDVAASAAASRSAAHRAVRGLAAQVEIEYAAPLRARAEQSPTTPFMVRVSPVAGTNRQKIEFVGSVAGDFDLREHLEREDGRPLADLAPIPVTVVTHLPPNHGTDLFLTPETWFDWRAYYREIMWTVAGLWAAVPIVYWVTRRLRAKPSIAPAPPIAPVLSLEDQLRAALAAAAAGRLTVAERGRLELLVLRYLGARLDMPLDRTADFAATLAALRDRSETRPFVLALERWLHADGGEAERAHAAAALEELRRSRLAAAAPAPAEVRP